jgi:hypothetical protein
VSKVKNLNLAALKKEDAKQFNVQRQVEIKGYTLTVDKVFRTTKITAMLKEMVEKVLDLRTKGVDINQLDFTSYGMLLTIKHFSSVDVPNTIEEQLRMLEILVDNEFLLPIVESFEETELEKIRSAVEKMSENIVTLLEKAKDIELKNADILSFIDGAVQVEE